MSLRVKGPHIRRWTSSVERKIRMNYAWSWTIGRLTNGLNEIATHCLPSKQRISPRISQQKAVRNIHTQSDISRIDQCATYVPKERIIHQDLRPILQKYPKKLARVSGTTWTILGFSHGKILKERRYIEESVTNCLT